MKHMYSRALSVLLMLALIVSIFAGTLSASAISTNNASRHQVCTQLSSQAKSYYTGQYTYDTMSKLDGGTTSCLQAVNSPLYKSLNTLMKTTMTNSVSYKSLTSYWDETDNNLLIYSDQTTNSNISREHVWPKSRASFYQSGGGSDLHHLRPEDAGVNSARSNYTMGNVRDVLANYSTKEYGGKTVLYYSPGNDLVEVNDNVKGDVARIFLYVYVRWQEPNLFENTPNPVVGSGDNENNGMKVIANLDTLLQWCEMDPVDEWEMRRNDLCQDVQHNRNVFIDYPEYAWLLFGQEIPTDMTTPSGMAKESGPQYTLTAVANPASSGKVSVSGRTVTATANTGYEINATTPYSLEGTATVTRSGNTFTVSKMQSDCTLTVNFSARTPAAITYIVPAGVTYSGTTSAYVGDTVKLATVSGTPTGTEGYTFFGWSKTGVEDTTSAPAVTAANANYKLTAAQNTFYSVFRYTKDGATHYISNPCKHEKTHEQRVEPTCTKAGAINLVCDDCGAIVATTPIPATGHSYEDTIVAPTCTQMGYTLHTCKNCGDSYRNHFTDALGHDWDAGEVTKEPTQTQDGELTRHCTRCDEILIEPIAATGVHECPCDAYDDLDNTLWYHEGIDLMLNKGYMNGVAERTFNPNGTTNRAMVVTILWRIEGKPQAESANPFTDVKDGLWYTDAIAWAAEKDIVDGVASDRFSPEGKITREQMATILYRYANSKDVDTSATTDLNAFPDANAASPWAKTALGWTVAEGIINGNSGKLDAQGPATRAQVATIFSRYLDAID